MKATRLFCLLTLVFTGLIFSSCSDDNNKNDNGNGNDGSGSIRVSVSDSASTTFGPKNVFTGDLLKTIYGSTIKYNSDGLVEEISDSKQKTTFEYQSKTKSTGDITTVIMKFNESGNPTYSYSVEFTIGSNGFASSALQTYADKSTKTWEFKYNSDGQLNYMKCIAGDNIDITTITYDNDGNITTVKIESNKGNYTTNQSQSIEYTSETHPNGIENKACIMLFDLTFGTDTDNIDSAYYAGLLGRATQKLPLKNIERESDGKVNTNEFNWTLNEKGYPTKLIGYIENDDDVSIVFGW